jgi:ABC-type Fe3+-hydroxamate transport system substrate-binding protein
LDRHKYFAVLIFIAAMTLAVSGCTQQPQKSPLAESKPEVTISDNNPRVPDEYIVTLAPEADKGIISEYYGRYGIKDIYALGGETYLLVLQNDPGPTRMVTLVDEDSRVMVVQPNLVYWDNRSGSIIK